MEEPGASPAERGVKNSPSTGESSAQLSRAALALDAKPAVPDYELLRRIGHGAYGDVWLARSGATGVFRAAKIVWRRSFEDDRPFRREFEGIQHFERISREHPSQLALFHIGRNEAEGYFYYVMELADAAEPGPDAVGRDVPIAPRRAGDSPPYRPHTLRADLEKGRLPATKVLEIGLALSEALAHLHSKGLVHRDVKPSNVIFVNGRPKLADIGLVTDASDQCSIVGTEGYLPPEGPGTPQADIFALGKVLYEAATGLDRRKFPQLPPELRSWSDAAQVFELNEIILKACAQVPEGRYQTCDEMYTELALLEKGKSVRQKRTWERRWTVGKRAGFTLSILAVIVALMSILPRHSSRSQPSSDGPDSTNLEANALCDKAMYILRGDNVAEFATAYANFNKAIALDPYFARPYVGLLELRARDSVPGLPAPTREVMRENARNLERLAPHLAATYVAQAIVNWSDSNYQEAERCILKAIKANPNYELAHTWYSWPLACYGRPQEAYKQLEIAQQLSPSKVTIYWGYGNIYYVERQYSNAIAWYQTAIQWEPHQAVAYWGIARSLQAMGDYTNALNYDEKADRLNGQGEAETKQDYDEKRRALDQRGITGYWQLHWKRTAANTNTDFYRKATVRIHLLDTNAALDWLEKSYEKHEVCDNFQNPLERLLYDDCWDGLHEEPRFKRLLDKIGFTKVMPPGRK